MHTSWPAQRQVTFADGTRHPARLVGSYAPDDLAVVSVGALAGLKPARFADASRVEVGNIVLAVGNLLRLQSSVTDGIVSALGRTVSEGQGVVLPKCDPDERRSLQARAAAPWSTSKRG